MRALDALHRPVVFGTLALGLTLTATGVAVAAPAELAAASAAANRGEFALCRAELEQVAAASAAQPGLPRRALWGAALCAAQAKEIDAAFALAHRAVELGFHDDDRFYFDPRLQPLRTDLRWIELERRFVAARARWNAELDAELVALVAEDAQDRRPGAGAPDFDDLLARDRQRVAKAMALVDAGEAKRPGDLLNAARLLARAESAAELELAHDLARRAAEADADLPGARQLAASTLDRALVVAGKPQKYGTQTLLVNNVWRLAPLDPATNDAERALWDVPSLEEIRRRVATMQGPSTPAPSAPPLPTTPAAAPAKVPAADPPSGR